MKPILLVLLAFGTLSTLSAATELCLPDKEASINILAGSERNSTGHWLISATSERTQQRRNTRRFEMDVHQSIRSCDDTDIIQLTITATIKPPSGSKPDRRKPVTEMISTTEAPIKPGYIHFKGFGWYKVHTFPNYANWTTARETCQREGGDLMVIDSRDELRVVYPVLEEKVVLFFPWLGVYDPGHNGSWITVHGGSVPSDWWDSPATGKEYCAKSIRGGHIVEHPCDDKNSYICELFT